MGCCYQIYGFGKIYFQYPIVVTLEVEQIDTLDFPAVTVCNQNRVMEKFRKCMKKPNEFEGCVNMVIRFPNVVGNMSPFFILSERRSMMSSCKNNKYEVEQGSFKYEKYLFLKMYMQLNETQRIMIGHQAIDFIDQCSFNGKACSSHDFETFSSLRYGNCFTFKNPNKNRDFDVGLVSQRGLELVLNLDLNNYVDVTELVGARVIVHNPLEDPNPEENGIDVNPGFATSIAFSERQMKRLPFPFKDQCKNYGIRSQIKDTFTNYSNTFNSDMNTFDTGGLLPLPFPPILVYNYTNEFINEDIPIYNGTFKFSKVPNLFKNGINHFDNDANQLYNYTNEFGNGGIVLNNSGNMFTNDGIMINQEGYLFNNDGNHINRDGNQFNDSSNSNEENVFNDDVNQFNNDDKDFNNDANQFHNKTNQFYKEINQLHNDSTMLGCVKRLIQERSLSRCGCTDPTLPKIKNSEHCSLFNPTQMCCLDESLTDVSEDESDLVCPFACVSTSYKEIVSVAKWPSEAYFSKMKTDGVTNLWSNDAYKRRFVKVNIFRSSSLRKAFVQAPKFMSEELLGCIGLREEFRNDGNKAILITKYCIFKNLLVSSVGSLLLLMTADVLEVYQSTLNAEGGVGIASIAVQYFFSVVSAFFLPKYLIKRFGCKFVIVLSMLCFIPFVCVNFYPLYPLMMVSSMFLGVGFSLYMGTVDTYVNDLASFYKKLKEDSIIKELEVKPQGTTVSYATFYRVDKDNFNQSDAPASMEFNKVYPEDVNVIPHHPSAQPGLKFSQRYSESITSRFFGFHGMIYQSSFIWGSLMSYFVLQNSYASSTTITSFNDTCVCGSGYCGDKPVCLAENLVQPTPETRNLLLSICLVLCIFAILVVILFIDDLKGRDKSVSLSLKMLFSTFRQAQKRDHILLIPLTMHNGMIKAFYLTEFTKAYVGCSWGISHVGLVTAIGGATVALSSTLSGWLVRYTGVPFIFSAAAVLNVALNVLLVVWKPDPDHPEMLFVIGVLWGMVFGIFYTQTKSFYGILFKDNEEAAYGVLQLWQCVGSVLCLIYSSHICNDVKIYILSAFGLLGIIGFYIVELLHARERSANDGGVVFMHGELTDNGVGGKQFPQQDNTVF
ncbi:hypothetical protein JTE90_024608 [Oedothorax gibbosus]|uniref:Uncharacterized protein n=1 Tax=Oedothorax gibbosus TaxID=931172 RepID=A0AAV6U1H1_9ARAC|nr:hypothetical protein JTE90_024608 [Oedothorax gibbosus]